jgi:hypothetical protein
VVRDSAPKALTKFGPARESSVGFRGFAAPQCGKALPYRSRNTSFAAVPPDVPCGSAPPSHPKSFGLRP